MIEILYENSEIVFCVKPQGFSSEKDMPDHLKEQLGCDIYTLHRLDNPVGGVMVYAKTKDAAAKFSKKISENTDFEKTYLTVCEGVFEEKNGIMEDLLFKDSSKNKSFVVKKERKGAFGISVLVGMVYSIMLLLITALGFGDGYRGVPVTILVIVSGCIITVIARKDRTKTGNVRRNRK